MFNGKKNEFLIDCPILDMLFLSVGQEYPGFPFFCICTFEWYSSSFDIIINIPTCIDQE